MGDSNDPNAWAGLLKWSLSHHDGTAPSEARPISDEDRQWLEKVVSDGVRDEIKAMAQIYERLCAYLDLVAVTSRSSTAPTPGVASEPPRVSGAAAGSGTPSAAGQSGPAEGEAADAGAASGAGTTASTTGAPLGRTLSLYVAPAPHAPAESRGRVPDAAAREAAAAGDEDKVDEIVNDLEELQDIVEQIDMAETFVKIGGFGRLIALATPPYRPEKLRLRAASVIATLTKNNPPAQAAFAGSEGQKALLEAASFASAEEGMAPRPSPALRLAFLHALSCSAMGNTAAEDALCAERGFQDLLRRALAQAGEEAEGGAGGVDQDDGIGSERVMRAKLRSKAAFVLKALVGAPESSSARVESLWPAVLGLLEGLEALVETRPGDDPAVARETCIESLLTISRSVGGERLLSELGGRVAMIMARRRQVLVAEGAGSPGPTAHSEEDQETAAVELGLWMQWEQLSGPPQ